MVEGEEKKEIKKGNKKEEKQAPLSTVNRLCRAGLMFRFLFIIVWSKPATFIKLLGRNQQRSLIAWSGPTAFLFHHHYKILAC